MPIFPSDEWMEDFRDGLEGHPGAGAMARALEGVYRFVIEPAGGLLQTRTYEVAIHRDGEGAQVSLPPAGAGHPRLQITANYDRWVQLLQGRLDLTSAVLLRRVRISGDLGTVRRNLSDARPLLDALSGVQSTFLSQP